MRNCGGTWHDQRAYGESTCNKPVRKARRFFKKSFPQLRQPKGKGKGRYHAMTNMDAHQHDQVFFGGKGSSKGKHRTTGKGFGRRTNPTGPDGEIMKCTVCDSTEHFRAMCTRNQSSSSGANTGLVNPQYAVTSEPTHVCPLADILFYNQIETNAFSRMNQPMKKISTIRPSTFHVPELIPATSFRSIPQSTS